MIVSHIDSPRLDVMPNNPFETKDNETFCKVAPYGGIIAQLWLDRPLVLVGQAYNNKGKLVKLNTEDDNLFFTISSLLPHLGGRKETSDLSYSKLMVRMGNDVLSFFEDKYRIGEEEFKFAELSFVPAGKAMDIGVDRNLIASYGHDDRACVFAELEAMFNSEQSNRTKIALFTSYEETGSGQSTGAESEFIDDIFLELTKGNQLIMRRAIKNTKLISAAVCAGFDKVYSDHFEESCKVIAGKGVGIAPFLGSKRGNDATIKMREAIRKLCEYNEINYQIETAKVGEVGGGTVSTLFCIKGMEAIDIGVPVLAMHSPQELIHKEDLKAAYNLYKIFFEN
jgi:aspartyl aminopeptidase